MERLDARVRRQLLQLEGAHQRAVESVRFFGGCSAFVLDESSAALQQPSVRDDSVPSVARAAHR